MSSDPKKPGFDAPPQGTPELLQKDVGLDRRRRVPSFEELQRPPEPDVPTDPLRPAMNRPIPNATVPARPSNLEEITAPQRPVPPGLHLRQPVVPIRTPTPPTQPQRVAIPGPPPAPQQRPPPPPPARPAARAAPPPGNTPRPAAQPQRTPAPSPVPTQPVRAPVPSQSSPPEQRAEPPPPTSFAQHRPQPAAMPAPMPQVTPSVPSQGGLRPDGQPALRLSQQGMKAAPPPASALPPREVDDDPEPRTVPAGAGLPRNFTPAPFPPKKPNALPSELLVTQPGLPGPFAQARQLPQPQAVPQRPPSLPELPRAHAPDSSLQPALGEEPRFEQASFEGDTVTAEPAALWRRVGAWLADLVFVSALVLIFLMVAITVIAPKNLTPMQQLMAVALPGVALAGVLAVVYTTLFAFLWAGRTPGRRLMGIRLVDVTGHSPGPARALLRAVLSLVSFALCLSGFWLALFDRHGQTLHDKLTRTFVVKLQDA